MPQKPHGHFPEFIIIFPPLLPSSSSCHQTGIIHLSTHLFYLSLKLLRSSNDEQGRARRVNFIMCAVFSVARPHSNVTSPSKYPHFCLCALLHVNPVRSRFRHIHVVHGLSYPLARLSLRLIVTLCGIICNLLSHSLHRMTLGGISAGFTLRKKQFMDLRLLSAGCCPYRESALLVFCLFHSSTYISPDVGWRNSSYQKQIFYIGWFQAFRDGSVCTV